MDEKKSLDVSSDVDNHKVNSDSAPNLPLNLENLKVKEETDTDTPQTEEQEDRGHGHGHGHGQQKQCLCTAEQSYDVTFGPCEDVKEVMVNDVKLHCEGRLLMVKVKLDNVCASRKVNVGVVVSEKKAGSYKTVGLKTAQLTIPGRPGTCMNNMEIGDFCFVFPEKVMCGHRKFKVNVIAHYSSFANISMCCD
ncbi:MAG: hypothetical protein GX318_05820 [Clostridia bacterium]|nr:hypothetical protein [Clostridia bacterium]